MIESEWNECDDAPSMLAFLRRRSGQRKLRLFACACARARVSLPLQSFRSAVEVAERVADGLGSPRDLRVASEDVFFSAFGCASSEEADAYRMADDALDDFSGLGASLAAERARGDGPRLIREIFGNPFREARFDASSLRGDDGHIRALAETIYEERCFDDLPRLSDLLAAAGCLDAELLAHLRAPGPHFRGCWALDDILGKGPGKDVVSEEDWLRDTHPMHLLMWWTYLRGEPSPRKHRLLACAACRLRWSEIRDDRLRRGVEIAEAFADGLVDHAEVERAHKVAFGIDKSMGRFSERRATDSPRWKALTTSSALAQAVASAADPRGRVGNALHEAARGGGGG